MEQNFNHVLLCGQVLTQPQPSHVNHSQSFSRFLLSVPRLSGQEDCLPVIVPQPLLELCPLSPGAAVTVTGQLRSFNNRSGQGPRLVVSVFAQTLQPGGEGPVNRIRLSGVLCKPPTLRCTPLGREICDIILAVNRRYGRADYLLSGVPMTPQCITLHNKTIILYYGSSPFSSENLADFPGFFSGIFPHPSAHHPGNR